jgi:hypothetical protein
MPSDITAGQCALTGPSELLNPEISDDETVTGSVSFLFLSFLFLSSRNWKVYDYTGLGHTEFSQ